MLILQSMNSLYLRSIWTDSVFSHSVVCLAVAVAEDSVSAAGTEPWAVLWRIFAKRQSDWEQQYWYAFSGEGLYILELATENSVSLNNKTYYENLGDFSKISFTSVSYKALSISEAK